MPWIIAGAAILGTAANISSQNQANKANRTSSALQSAGNRIPATNYTPTATANRPPAGAMDFDSLGPPVANQTAASAPPPSGGGGNTLGNINNAVQLGATLQSIFRNEGDRRRAMSSQAQLPRPQQMAPYQPTAYDPRLQQILGRR
jgi:hypothetical protein